MTARSKALDKPAKAAGAIMETVLKDIRNWKKTGCSKLTTGFDLLDEHFCWRNGNLVVIAGYPSVGKTAFALGVAEHLGVDKAKPVLYFSLGSYKEDLLERMLFSRAGIDRFEAKRNGGLKQQDWSKLRKVAAEIAAAPLYFEDTPRLTPEELHDSAKQFVETQGVRLIIVDYLQEMRLGDRLELHEKEFAEIGSRLKRLAVELDVPVCVLAQLSLDSAWEEDELNEPRMADFGDAVIIERYADTLMMLIRYIFFREFMPRNQEAEIKIVRDRNHSRSIVALGFDAELGRLGDIGT